MPRALKACGQCGTPGPVTPCPACAPKKAPGRHTRSSTQRGYDHQWQRLRAQAIQRQPWCARCGTTDDLTGDHIVPIRDAPERRLDPTNVEVLCRPCNSRKQ